MARRKPPIDSERYPSIYIEALAYHEAGHAVMAVLLELPIARIAIGPACDSPEYNGKVFLDPETCPQKLPIFKVGLIEVASEQAEKLCPRYDQFRTIHKKHPHLKPFTLGVKADLISGFEAVKVTYRLMRLAESTAKKQFKSEDRDRAAKLIDLNREAVCRLAERLMQNHELDGAAATSVVLAGGPLKHAGLLLYCRFPEQSSAGYA